MSAHTPGPWTVRRNRDGQDRIYGNVDGAPIAVMWTASNTKQDAANARVLAAAPELLTELEKWIAFALGNGKRPNVEDGRAAIAKAAGGAP